MKKLNSILGLLTIYTLLLSFPVSTIANNPLITNNMVNLSDEDSNTEIDDRSPEMIIDGNVIHTIWIETGASWDDATDVALYYRRSPDLGDTWETPIKIHTYIDKSNNNDPSPRRLAIDNGVVHICVTDYSHSDNGTSYLFYYRSTNSGVSFETKKEIANDGGGYKGYVQDRAYIKAVSGKVIITLSGYNSMSGTWLFSSSDGGDNFDKKQISENGNNVGDLFFDGNQIVVLYDYTYYFYGLNQGHVWVSVSDDLGLSFTTSRISIINANESELCYVSHDQHYSPKIAKSGNNIHIIFSNLYDSPNNLSTIMYTHSDDNGQTFKTAVDINNETIAGNRIQGHATITAKGNYVYMTYLSDWGAAYYLKSSDNGNTLSTPKNILTDNTDYLKTTWNPILLCDPNDASGQTVYFGGGKALCRKSIDGGITFSNGFYVTPFLEENKFDVKNHQLAIDKNGDIHWLIRSKFTFDTDYDIYYVNKKQQPIPSEINKAINIKTIDNYTYETVIIPSSESLQFSDEISAEAWVKIKTDNPTKLSILAKVNGTDGDQNNPSGFNLGFHDDRGKRYLNSGIETDKGKFVNWSSGEVNDELWHHIAFTYDANDVPNNFKTYLDGILVAEETVTGKVIGGDGLLMIGSRNYFYKTYDYEIDDIRIWDRALSQDEIIENQNRQFTNAEEGLKLFLNFDDTFKDISGNNNDAIPLYLGDLNISDFDPPITKFDQHKTINKVVFTNTTENADEYIWNFGDENNSEIGSPTHTYTEPGEYQVSLTSKNENSVTSAISHVTVVGMSKVEPFESGNIGYTTINVIGGGFEPENSTMKLRSEGTDDIEGISITEVEEGKLSAIFYLEGQKIGPKDIVITNNGVETVLTDSFNIIEGEIADPWVQILGRGNVLLNTWSTYTVEYGNNGNTDALGVPLFLVFSDNEGFDIEFIDVEIEDPVNYDEALIASVKDSVEIFFIVEDYFGAGKNGRVYPLYIPNIESNSSNNFHIRLKTSSNLEVESWVSDPFYSGEIYDVAKINDTADGDIPFSEMNYDARLCIGGSVARAVKDGIVNIAGVALPLACLNSTISLAMDPFDHSPKTKKVTSIRSTMYTVSCWLLACASDLPIGKVPKLAVAIISTGTSFYDAYKANKACRDAWLKKSHGKRSIGAVSSFDPNEIIGPDGYGNKNYIKLNNVIPYQIYFENKSSATAPAHTVRVVDTLDLSIFDLESFGFGSFGFGDTIITMSGYRSNEFSVDIDLRPDIETIARISGKLDTESGEIVWEFRSLNPTTMVLEEDPSIGFLPPNSLSPEGEGFVSYHIGLKQTLTTDTEIKNKATIIFDANEPIITNEYLNVLDIDVPESKITDLAAEINDLSFNVEWTGSDNGSGINEYSVWVLVNDTLLTPWIVDTTGTSAIFTGISDYSYKFYSIATDNVSWIEEAPFTYDAQTIILGNDEFSSPNSNLLVFPNPARSIIHLKLENTSHKEYNLEVFNVVGEQILIKKIKGKDLKAGISINLDFCNTGTYIIQVTSENTIYYKKIIMK